MSNDLVALSVVLGLVAAGYLAVAGYVWSHRRVAGGPALTVLLLAAGVWTVCNAVEVALPDPADQAVWGDIKYVGIVLLPPALLVFALEYTGRIRSLTLTNLALLSIEPVVVLGALSIPATQHLVRSVPADAPYGEYAVAQTGPLFWVNAVYSYALVSVAIGLIVVATLAVTRRRAGAWLLVGSCVLPLLLNIAYNLGFEEYFPIDPTPIGFSVAGFVLVWGFFRFKLSDLVPMGRKQVVEQLPDAVLVLDLQGRIVDVNPAAASLVGERESTLVGREVHDVLSQLSGLFESTPLQEAASTTARARGRDGGVLDLAVTLSPLPGGGAPSSGRLVVLRDVTAQRDVERRLRELVAERTGIIETLRRGLYPLRLPEIPGLQVAAVLDPAEAETSIGGDFLDVRTIGSGRWALMLGDVVGKGAGAATLTALARHTTIALTALGWLPSRVLARVSDAISDDSGLDPAGDVRFCTMALATVEPGEDSAEVLLSLGGHPRPMFVSDRGVVSEVGVPGSLLGVLSDPELHDVRLGLRPGEYLVMFSDGVTEARRGMEAFGEQRLIELLSRLAGTPPAHIVHEVVGSVRAFSAQEEHRDDIAVLVVGVPTPDAEPGR
ncbi:histidine kinase N-terminal 7TM domain-containing protein [Angustibacter sp. McL0619]|uniref:histidine kinase N-terminal 7TM domain-containing protein n=1 Tax=Angustibacter sp. McL0619 TaxID=3415676 RepID=UPI003CF099D4